MKLKPAFLLRTITAMAAVAALVSGLAFTAAPAEASSYGTFELCNSFGPTLDAWDNDVSNYFLGQASLGNCTTFGNPSDPVNIGIYINNADPAYEVASLNVWGNCTVGFYINDPAPPYYTYSGDCN
jgi:hypothetical protein